MKVLILSQFFYPEMGAPAARFLDFARFFRDRGHQVMILTGFPNFPGGKVHPGYEGKKFMVEEFEGFTVYRSWLHASPKLGFANKALGYASFTLSSFMVGASRIPEFDILLATAPPPTIGLTALALAIGRDKPLIYDLRDLWPEALVNSGRLRNKRLASAFEWVNARTYERASAITTVSEGKREALEARGVPAGKVHVIPNGVSIPDFDRNAAQQEGAVHGILGEYGVPRDAFKVTYAGIMNPPQGLEILVSLADRVQHQCPKVHFVLVGNGSERGRLEEAASRLPNLTVIPEQPRERIPAFLTASDVNIVTLRPRKDTHTVPSKIFEYMAAGRPLLLSADGEPVSILEASEGGIGSPAGDLECLRRNFMRMVQSPELRCSAGQNARKFVEEEYSRSELNRRFLHLVENVLAERVR